MKRIYYNCAELQQLFALKSSLKIIPTADTHHFKYFNDHFHGKPGLASCPIDTTSPVILIPSVLSSQDRTKLFILLK